MENQFIYADNKYGVLDGKIKKSVAEIYTQEHYPINKGYVELHFRVEASDGDCVKLYFNLQGRWAELRKKRAASISYTK
ncbi:hypothetical protein BGI33_03815 [Snodgrassella alvi]|uniref:Uncharacterized protein n=1 Tax=Snodgrassella alvi TaxID=1196083 RepID=A0A2N9WQX3_9NEIS|nr:hypothetical protein BGI32_09795 [Snodgrassella alvi]PIT16480.1 hypothetical protein BGI33_03815 [Snodgrassella alvi]PIT18404.1 hypothetical protein BGI34_05275 [Snodgrassella alvi]